MMIHSNRFAGKVAVVTGAAQGIGRDVALRIAREGGSVAMVDRSKLVEDVCHEAEADGTQAIAIIADLETFAGATDSMDSTLSRFGRIDILINNAAIRDEKAIEQMTIADWRAVMAVILEGAFHCVQACLPALKQSAAGAIVNIGGLSAHTGSRHRAHVIAAKAGLIGLTHALAHDLAAHKITVNCVSPGLIERPRDPGLPEPQHHQVNRTLFGQNGTPGDVAAVVRFLCGPGGRYVNGQTIHANGGAFLT
jgi:3-oxoacyl-[acyl-carrier protein] reductase